MEIESYSNECVSSNILEKPGKFSPDKTVHHFIKFITSLHILLKKE